MASKTIFSSVIPTARDRAGNDPIFILNSEATRRAAAGESIINATIGALMTDGGELHLESAIPEAVRRELTRRGHTLKPAVGPYGGYQAIHFDAARKIYVGASESRKDGQAAGY